MPEYVRIAKVVISEDRFEPIVTLSDGKTLIVSSVSVDFPNQDTLPEVCITSDILYGVDNSE